MDTTRTERTERTERPAYYYGTGRRKSAVARVRLYPGNGQILVNSKSTEDYFGGRALYQQMVNQPLQLTDSIGKFNVTVKVLGGGVTGQAGAVRHGLARALIQADVAFRPALKKAGLLARDAREKERKKVGLKRARKAPQYTKR
ncbi:MAG: 30S ribosomal protein S9 [Chloroflexi bacterium]|nr:30S ribosomal protein S9 [Chloroflexota bacterium]